MMWIRSAVFTLIVPGAIAGWIPWLIGSATGVARPTAASAFHIAGVLLFMIGLVIYVACVREFVIVGRGTPSPIDAPKVLVVSGFYRYVRNPMYIGVFAVLLGEAAFFESGALLLYSLFLLACWHLFVLFYEEPTHRRRYGESWDWYARRVHRWLPGKPLIGAVPDRQSDSAAIRASCQILRAYVLEEARLFDVVDRLTELHRSGSLRVGGDQAGDRLEAYWRGSGERQTAAERAALYALVLGTPSQTGTAAASNDEFRALWARLIESLSEYVAEVKASSSSAPVRISTARAREAAAELAANLTTNVSDETVLAARRLTGTVDDATAIAGSGSIVHAFGAADMWQVIEAVTERYLDGTVNTAAYRQLASAGSSIVGWLAASDVLAGDSLDTIPAPAVVRRCIELRDHHGDRDHTDCSPPGPCEFLGAADRWIAADRSIDFPLGTHSAERR